MTNLYFINYKDATVPKVNPFSEDGKYDENWVFLKLAMTDDYILKTSTDTIFGLAVSRYISSWFYYLGDFIEYNRAHNRNIIFFGTRVILNTAFKRYKGHSNLDKSLRDHEPETLVHSISPANYKHIMESGYIKSWNMLKSENQVASDQTPIGKALGDPVDFSDYVMFGVGVMPEVIVSSKQKGYICMDENAKYEPGVRFYFDTSKLAESGILLRDGAHLKVMDKISIDMCSFKIKATDIDFGNMELTPRNFANLADKAFMERSNK